MLRVPIEQTQPGMILAQPVASPDKLEHLLLKRGFELDEETITRLRELRVRTIWVRYPQLDVLDDLVDPAILEGKQKLYGALKKGFGEGFDGNLAKVNYQEYISHMVSLFGIMLSDHSSVSPFIAELQGQSDDIFSHGIRVASIALLLGMRLEAYVIRERAQLPPRLAAQLAQLGVGAVLHDIGKLALPEELRSFHLTAQDMGAQQWQDHTEVGPFLRKAGVDASGVQVILNHHQHFDGTGFPPRKAPPGERELLFPMAGNNIHIFCRLTAIADRFDSFRYLPDGQMAPAVVGLKRLQNPGYQKWFDPHVYNTFLEVVQPFCPGEQVTLNDGQVVAVKELNTTRPCRPVVQPINLDWAVQPDSEPPDDEPPGIDLAAQPSLHIAAVGEFPVERYLY